MLNRYRFNCNYDSMASKWIGQMNEFSAKRILDNVANFESLLKNQSLFSARITRNFNSIIMPLQTDSLLKAMKRITRFNYTSLTSNFNKNIEWLSSHDFSARIQAFSQIRVPDLTKMYAKTFLDIRKYPDSLSLKMETLEKGTDFQKSIESLQESINKKIASVNTYQDVNKVIGDISQESVKQINKIENPHEKFQYIATIINLFIQIIVALFTIFSPQQSTTTNINNYHIHKTIIKKEVKTINNNDNIPSYYLNQIRINIKDDLPVFEGRKVSSQKVDSVPMGKIIRVIEKRKNWCYITYRIDDNLHSGWVFTRYLTKLKP